MQNSINSDLIRGHIDTIILSILYVNDRYGYEILGEIDEKSSGHYKIKQPTLYSCLKRLESQGFIYSYRGDETESGGGRRKYYALTELGKELFKKNQVDWEYSRSVIDKLVSDKPFQFAVAGSGGSMQSDAQAEACEVVPGQDAATLNETLMSFDADDGQKRSDENIDGYFTGTESASYIDKVVGNSEIVSEDRASFQIHNFADIDTDKSAADGRVLSQTDAFDEEEYTKRSAYNNALLSDALEREYLEQQETPPGDAGPAAAKDSASQTDDGQSGLFKSYSVDISEVEEYNHGIQHKKPGKSLLDLLEEESKTRREKTKQDPPAAAAKTESAKIARESDNDIVINREYKSIIKQLLSGNDNFAVNSPVASFVAAPASTIARTEPAKEAPIHKQWREQANFDKVADSVRSMGDDIKIRTYNSEADKEYSELYYYNPNKLMLYQFGLMFIIMLLEILVPYMIIKFGAGINSAADLPVLIISILIAAAFPVYAIIANFRNPNKRKRYNLDFKNSFTFRLIVFVLLLVIIYAANVVFKMDVANPAQYLMSLMIPALLSTNVPISLLIFRGLYGTEKFNIE